jgi:HD superfamily phosphodiesterase
MKKLIKEEVGTLDINNDAEDIIAQLQDMIAVHGAGKVSCSIEEHRYSDGDKYIAILAEREETDDEYEARIAQEKEWSIQREANDRRLFEELSKKYAK